MRANLSDDLVEQMLFIRENKLRDEDIHKLTDDVTYVEAFDDAIDDVWYIIFDDFDEVWHIDVDVSLETFFSKCVFSPRAGPQAALCGPHGSNPS